MARDATRMPFPRSTSFQKSDSTEHASDSNNKLDVSLKAENMLLEEFNYASLTAYQAMEDRARITVSTTCCSAFWHRAGSYLSIQRGCTCHSIIHGSDFANDCCHSKRHLFYHYHSLASNV